MPTLPWLTPLPAHPAGTGERNRFLPCAKSDAHEGGMRLNRQRWDRSSNEGFISTGDTLKERRHPHNTAQQWNLWRCRKVLTQEASTVLGCRASLLGSETHIPSALESALFPQHLTVLLPWVLFWAVKLFTRQHRGYLQESCLLKTREWAHSSPCVLSQAACWLR